MSSNNKNPNENTTLINLYSSNEPLNINLSSLISSNINDTFHSISTTNDLLIISQSSNEHPILTEMLKKKKDSLLLLLKWWKENNISSVINAMRVMKDKIILNDFFNYAFLNGEPEKISFSKEDLHQILLLLFKLVNEKYDSYVRTGISCSSFILKYVLNKNLSFLCDLKEGFIEIRKANIFEKILNKKYNKEIYDIAFKYDELLNEAIGKR